MLYKVILSTLVLAASVVVDGAHILIFCALTTKSEMGLFYPYAETLVLRGHQVTFLTPYPSNKPRHKGITFISPKELMENTVADVASEVLRDKLNGEMGEWSWIASIEMYVDLAAKTSMIGSNEVRDFVNSGAKVDLMIINGAMNDFGLPLVHIFKCPFIIMSGSGVYPWALRSVGAPLSTAYAPSLISEFGDRMTFWERASNTLRVLAWNYVRERVIIPKLEEQLKPFYIREDTPPLMDIERNVSFILNCRDTSLEYPRSYPPNVISIGCLHCQDPKPLPKDLAAYLDGSGDAGFIYFSFGSVVKLNKNVEFIQKTFFKAFAKLPQRILVKWDKPVTNEEVGAPPNVKLAEWLPQQDILGHPKIKAFITHGGLFSTMETVYHGVPVLSFPFFWDQDYNAGLADRFGFGIKMDIVTVTAEKIVNALHRLTTDPSFQENVKERSSVFRDKPEPPMDRAVFWTEYALRHNGAAHLRSVSRELPAYQLYLLDVIFVFVASASFVIVLLFCMFRSFFRMLLSMFFKPKSKKD